RHATQSRDLLQHGFDNDIFVALLLLTRRKHLRQNLRQLLVAGQDALPCFAVDQMRRSGLSSSEDSVEILQSTGRSNEIHAFGGASDGGQGGLADLKTFPGGGPAF